MKNEVTAKGTMTSAAAIAVLEDLLASLKSGKVVVQHGSEYVALKPAETIEVEIGAAKKKGKEKLFLEMSWLQEIPVQQGPQAFRITAEEPAPEETPVESAVGEGAAILITSCDEVGCVAEVVEVSAPAESRAGGRRKG